MGWALGVLVVVDVFEDVSRKDFRSVGVLRRFTFSGSPSLELTANGGVA